MALQAVLSFPLATSTQFSINSHKKVPYANVFRSIRCVSANVAATDGLVTSRRSANYESTVWDYDLLQSLPSKTSEEKPTKQVEKLKNEVKSLINREMEPLAKLELIDEVQRLGLKYQFELEIKDALNAVYSNTNNGWPYDDDLYATALRFGLFRQHGYHAPEDVFERFKDEKGEFKASLCEDVKGMLSMYEASFLGFEGESNIEEAKLFSTKSLMALKTSTSGSFGRKIEHALDMPIHWRLNRLEARWFIDAYEQEQHMNPALLQLAKLDFNMLQSIYQKEVGKLARWWTVDLGLNKINFSRDRLVEHYFWFCGLAFEPKFESFREMGTKIICFITYIDDVYDVYGSLEELELLTDFGERWDITRIDKLPDMIKTILLAMYNTTNEIGYWTMKEKGFNIIPYLRKEWAKLCKAYLTEAKWYHKGYKPRFEEYLDNAVISIAAPIVLFCTYFLTAEKITMEALDYIDKLPTIMHCSSLILRLTNDLGTSSYELARGDNLKAVQCYMNERGVSEEVGRQHINDIVHKTWKTMNEAMVGDYPFSEPFLSASPNLARAVQFFYHYGDGHGAPGSTTKGHLMPLLLQPIPVIS